MKIGLAFPDYIRSESLPKRRHHENSDGGGRKLRAYILPFILSVVTILFAGRLFYLQVLQGANFRNLSDTNRVRTTIVHAPRGIIFDRNGKPLVYNQPGFRKIEGEKITLLTPEEALGKLTTLDNHLEIDSLRVYSAKESAAHVIGYIGQITREEYDAFGKSENYLPQDLVGKFGIEKQYEKRLRGVDGKELVEVDAMGHIKRRLGKTDPTSGENITITLDSALQEVAYKALSDIKKGVVIVSNPQGEILAMVSKPTFDPNFFTLGNRYKSATDSAYQSVSDILLDGKNQPLLNRAIAGTYPPGSTYKLITAAAGLENKIIDENYEVEDTGVTKIGASSFANWYFTDYGRTDGSVNVVKAIKRSNDIFFYKLADKVGVDKLAEMSRRFGLGERTGIDLEGEARGLVPDVAWKKKALGENWYSGDNYNYGIGQGYLLTTPLQVNLWTQAIANGGTEYYPRLLIDAPATKKAEGLLTQKDFTLIRTGMEEACDPGGVAWPLFDFKVKNGKLKIDEKNILESPQSTTSADFKDYRHVTIACKTGTAQQGSEKTLPHAWITLYAPVYNPQIIVTVLAEESGQGSNVAAPVAKKILEEWFGR